MLRKMSIFFAVPLSLLLTASTVFLPETEETYFSSEEMIVIHESLDLLNLRIGYDYELKLHYITYTADFSEQDFYSKRLQLPLVLQRKNTTLLNSLYKKIYELSIRTEYEMQALRIADPGKHEKMRTSYLLPLKRYMNLLKSHIQARNPSLKAAIDESEKKIQGEVKQHYKKREELVFSFFTKEDLSILDRATQALDYDYGYDKEIELAYVFSFAHSEKNRAQKEKDFSKIIEQLKVDSLVDFHYKIYKLFSMTAYKMEIYRKRKDWRYYIYIKSDLFPPLKNFYTLIEKSALMKTPSLREALERSKKEIERWVRWYYDDREGILDTF